MNNNNNKKDHLFQVSADMWVTLDVSNLNIRKSS
jgi:hypothetical protein